MARNPKVISIYDHHPEASEYERMLRILSRQGYSFISLDELERWYQDPNSLNNEKSCFISLDDGFASNLKLLDACEKYQAPVTIFVATRPLVVGNYWWRYVYQLTKNEKTTGEAMQLPYDEFREFVARAERETSLERMAMTEQQLKQIASHPLVTIGSHTVTHTILPQMPDDILEQELRESKARLEHLAGKPCKAFSYPNGSLTPRDVEAVRKVYQIAFTTEQRRPRHGDDIMLVPRVGVTGAPIRDQLKIWGVWPWLKKTYQLIHRS